MKAERPILFNTEMVRAILSGKKTITRRIVKTPHLPHKNTFAIKPAPQFKGWSGHSTDLQTIEQIFKFPYGQIGDLLYVRETWAPAWDQTLYKANEQYGVYENQKWRPAIHMPKKAARIWLEITDLRAEKLQAITEADAIAEGVEECEFDTVNNLPTYRLYGWQNAVTVDGPIESYKSLWNHLDSENKSGFPWEANPWVFVITFKIISINGK